VGPACHGRGGRTARGRRRCRGHGVRRTRPRRAHARGAAGGALAATTAEGVTPAAVTPAVVTEAALDKGARGLAGDAVDRDRVGSGSLPSADGGGGGGRGRDVDVTSVPAAVTRAAAGRGGRERPCRRGRRPRRRCPSAGGGGRRCHRGDARRRGDSGEARRGGNERGFQNEDTTTRKKEQHVTEKPAQLWEENWAMAKKEKENKVGGGKAKETGQPLRIDGEGGGGGGGGGGGVTNGAWGHPTTAPGATPRARGRPRAA